MSAERLNHAKGRAIWRRWVDWVLFDARPVSAIFVQGVQQIFWGGWCLWWWDVYAASSIYGLMGEQVPEDWAGVALVILGVPLVLVPVAGENSRLYSLIVAAISVGAIWWAFVVVSCVEGNPYTTATSVYGTFCVTHLWFWSLLRRDL